MNTIQKAAVAACLVLVGWLGYNHFFNNNSASSGTIINAGINYASKFIGEGDIITTMRTRNAQLDIGRAIASTVNRLDTVPGLTEIGVLTCGFNTEDNSYDVFSMEYSKYREAGDQKYKTSVSKAPIVVKDASARNEQHMNDFVHLQHLTMFTAQKFQNECSKYEGKAVFAEINGAPVVVSYVVGYDTENTVSKIYVPTSNFGVISKDNGSENMVALAMDPAFYGIQSQLSTAFRAVNQNPNTMINYGKFASDKSMLNKIISTFGTSIINRIRSMLYQLDIATTASIQVQMPINGLKEIMMIKCTGDNIFSAYHNTYRHAGNKVYRSGTIKENIELNDLSTRDPKYTQELIQLNKLRRYINEKHQVSCDACLIFADINGPVVISFATYTKSDGKTQIFVPSKDFGGISIDNESGRALEIARVDFLNTIKEQFANKFSSIKNGTGVTEKIK